jgi:hypothetical protein
MITDRDIVIKCFAEGGDPRTAKAGEFGQGKPVTIGADDSIEQAISTMQEHQVRRLPVIDGHDLVGILTQADIACTIRKTESGSSSSSFRSTECPAPQDGQQLPGISAGTDAAAAAWHPVRDILRPQNLRTATGYRPELRLDSAGGEPQLMCGEKR